MLVFNYTEWLRSLPYFALGYVLLKSSQVILLLPFPQCPGKGGGLTGKGLSARFSYSEYIQAGGISKDVATPSRDPPRQCQKWLVDSHSCR